MAEHDVETPSVEKQADSKIVDTLSINNLKTIGEALSFATGVLALDSVDSRRRFNGLADQAAGVLMKRIGELDPVEAGSIKKVEEAGLTRQLAEMNTALASMGQAIEILARSSAGTE